MHPDTARNIRPNPDNAKAWLKVLREIEEFVHASDAEGLTYICTVINRVLRMGGITRREHDRLLREVNLFLEPPLSGGDPARTITHAAWDGGYWPGDLSSDLKSHRREFRIRWLRWRAGLPHNHLPWAEN